MPYRITITPDAKSQLRNFPAREQRIIQAGVTRLLEQPTQPSKSIKLLRPNSFAAFELRLGDLRLLYNVDEESAEVVIMLVGRKAGNTLLVDGEEFHGHQGDSVQ